MLTFLRKKMKLIMIIVAVVFAFSMFYGLGYTGLQQFQKRKDQVFLKINGKDVDPARFNNIFSRLRQNFPEQLKPSDLVPAKHGAFSNDRILDNA